MTIIDRVGAICRDGLVHDRDGDHASLMHVNVLTKGAVRVNGVDHAFEIELGDRTAFRDNVRVSEVCCEICKAIVNSL